MGSNATLYEGGRRPPAPKIGGPAIGQLPANTGTNTIANNQSMIQRGFPVITDGNNNITSGLRRNDGSIVEGLGGQPLMLKADPNVPLNTSGVSQDIFDRMREMGGPNFRQEGDMGRYVAFNDPGQPGAGFSSYQDYLNAGNNPVTGTLGTLGGRRPISSSNFSGEKIIPTMEQYGAMVKLAPGVSLQEAYNNAFGPLAIQSPDSTAGIMSGLPQVPTPPGMPDNVFVGNATLPGPSPQLPLKPGISPLRPPNYDNLDEYQKGYLESDFYSPVGTADVRPYTYKGKEMSGSGTYVSGFQDYLNSIGQGDLFSSTPRPSFSPLSPPTIGSVQPLPNGTGIAPSTGMPQPINQPPMSPGELINPIKNTAPIQTPTEVPQPMNPVTGNTSPIGGSQQDFDAYMNSYVNDLINQRMKNVFGGIMSSFS